ncbi:MAG: right-handed parallel beta-helix repeat-containing protein, partial [Bacteroidales bacterium]
MRKLLTILFIFIALKISAADYYLSPTGDDGNSGTLASPWFTLNKAWIAIAAGDTVYMRGGTYTYLQTQWLTGKNGTAGNLIKIWRYQNEVPKITRGATFTYGSWTSGLYLSGNYIHMKGIEVYGFTQALGASMQFWAVNCSYCIFEELNIHHGAGGMYLEENAGGTTTENLILNSDFHHHYDPTTVSPGPYGNADGLAVGEIANSTSSNTVRGCRFYRNSDDGIDLWANEGYTLIDSCWAYHNGYREDGITQGGDGNGFKLGSVRTSRDVIRKKVTNCVSFENYDAGFSQNTWSTTLINPCELYNNIAYKNGKQIYKEPAYQFQGTIAGTTVNIFKNNIAYDNWNNSTILKEVTDISITNSWDGGYTVTDGDFVSIDSTGVSGARVNGAKPSVDYLKLVVGSDLVNTGTDVGIGFRGTAPDLGYFETVPVYYVKNGGNDALDGLTDATAWATVAKVNGFSFTADDSVLFKKGDIWREYISFVPPAGTASGRIVYSSYGTGNKPLFYGSKEENEDSDWTDQGGNIWKNADAQFNYGDGVGNLIFNGEESVGHKELTMGSVNAQGDWFWNDAERAVYLYSVGNPGTVYTDIECALDRTIITLGARDYITLDGLDVRYGGYHGIEGAYGNDNITIKNCHISFIGGCEFPDEMARVGNGIQF